MSDQEENTERRIVEVPSSALLIREERAKNPILSEMVSAALVVAAETGLANLSPEELIRIGKTFYLKDGPGATEANIKAFSFFYQAAQTGNSEAEWMIYECIRKGDGVSFDYPISIQWLKKASDSGHLEAIYRHSIYHLLGEEESPNWKEGISLLVSAADKNHPASLNALGIIYVSTDLLGFESEIRKTFNINCIGNLIDVVYSDSEIDYFTRNAKSDPKEGGFFLGRLFYFNLLNEENIFATTKLIETSANLENTCAQLTIAHMYAFQDRIYRILSQDERRDIPEKWHNRAANLGNIEARYILGIEKKPKLSPEERQHLNEEGMLFLKRSSDSEYPTGMYNFGRYCNRSTLKPNFPVDSKHLLGKAAHLGVSRAFFYYSDLCTSEIQKINNLILGAVKGDDACIGKLGAGYAWIKKYENKIEALEYIFRLSLTFDSPKFNKLVSRLKEEKNSLIGLDSESVKEIKSRVFK